MTNYFFLMENIQSAPKKTGDAISHLGEGNQTAAKAEMSHAGTHVKEAMTSKKNEFRIS